MQLPNAAQAYISRRKLTAYLLSETHTIGRIKARFFRALGFGTHNLVQLEQELLQIAQRGQVVKVERSSYGTKYVVDGQLETPKGEFAFIRTVWIVEQGQVCPRFVTAYPLRK
ncbi:MAG: hypothetical protein GXP41_11565 [Chloroflexi bacterium]|nr:hypothetical protein [Chloroflexota bacterium]